MGVYRTVTATFTCPVCGASYSSDVQFKTGDDYGMETYADGETAADLAPAKHSGITDAYCRACLVNLASEKNALEFRRIATAVAQGRLRLWPAWWQYDHSTASLHVTRTSADPTTPDEIRQAAEIPQTEAYNLNVWRFFGEHEVWDGELRIMPWSDVTSGPRWNEEHRSFVDAYASSRWSRGSGGFMDVDVIVGDDRRVRVDVDSARPV